MTFFPSPALADFYSLIGYKYISIDEAFTHDSNPGDNFLPDFNQPGSAGDSSIKKTQWLQLGARYVHELPMGSSLNFDAGALLDVADNKELVQNANDSRPSNIASFVYSKADMGFFAAAGYNLNYKKLKLGAQAELNFIRLEHGWDRFDNEEEQDSEYIFIPTIGPKIGYKLWGENSVEATFQLGKNWSAGATFQFKLW